MRTSSIGSVGCLDETLTHNGGSFGRDESGSVLPVAVLFLTVVLGFASLVVDMGHGYVLRDQLQVSADAAALAGVSQISDTVETKSAALDFAGKNMPASLHGAVLDSDDVVSGSWDVQSKIFTVGGTGGNAVQVTTRRAAANGNPAISFFASLFGLAQFDVAAISTAYADTCYQNGVLAGNQIQVDQDAVINGGLCMYGRNGIHFDQNATIEDGAKIAALDTAEIQFDQGATIAPGSITQATIALTLANDVSGMIDNYAAGLELPDQITSVVSGNSLPDNLISGTVYIINGDLEVGKNYSATDVIIAVRGNVEWGKNGVIANSADCTARSYS